MASGSQHEDLNRTHAAEGGSDRSFGFVFTFVFLVIGLWPVWSNRSSELMVHLPALLLSRWWALAIALCLLVIALVHPVWLSKANRLWMLVGVFIGRVVSPLMLGIVYYLVVTPTGLLMRLFRKDLLNLSMQPESDTYWITREPAGPEPESMKNQF